MSTEDMNAVAVRSSDWVCEPRTTAAREQRNGVGGAEWAEIPKHKPKALDLFCCAGGAAMGIHRAGFDVTGCDINPQPNYPFAFVQGNALDQDLSGFDFVWASPPCQAHSALKHRTGKDYECFIERTRAKLMAWGGPWIMENVMGAPLKSPVMLCGSAFGLRVRRHRLFESNVLLFAEPCCHHLQPEPLDVSGTGGPRVHAVRTDGKGGNSRKPKDLAEARAAMGIDWMTRRELSQAIPPAYSEYLCAQILSSLGGGGAERQGEEMCEQSRAGSHTAKSPASSRAERPYENTQNSKPG